MCAFCFATMYSGEFAAVPAATLASEFPPWQSVHPSGTVFVGCMVGASIGEWQLMHPADFRSASSRDCPRATASFSCGTRNSALSPTVKQTIAVTTNAARRKSLATPAPPSFRAKQRKQSLATVNIAKAITRCKHRRTSSEHDIFREWRAIRHAGAVVYADRVPNGRLQQNKFQRLGAFEAQKVRIDETFQLRRDIKIHSGVEQKNSRIHKVGLPLVLAGAQRRNQAARCSE